MLKKLFFRLEPDEDGYPPVSAESVWAEEQEPGRLVLDNIPFFATQATLGDVVDAVVEDGVLTYKTTVRHCGNSLIRIVCYKGTDPAEVRRQIEVLGCSSELDSHHSLISVNIPTNIDLKVVQAFLRQGAVEDKWDYEEPLLMQ